MVKIALIFRVAGGAGLLLGLLGLCGAQIASAQGGKKPPRAVQGSPVADVPNQPVFAFEKRTGAVDEALTVVLGSRQPLPDETTVAKARATLRSSSYVAAAAVIADLDRLRPDDVEAHAALFSLLGVVANEDAAIEYWSKKLISGSPRMPNPVRKPEKSKQPDQPKLQRSERRDPERLIRYLAIAHLYRAASGGNDRAKAAILEAARSPHREVKIAVVQYTYALNRNRWKARNELKSRLAPSDHYLLYRY